MMKKALTACFMTMVLSAGAAQLFAKKPSPVFLSECDAKNLACCPSTNNGSPLADCVETFQRSICFYQNGSYQVVPCI